MKKHLWTWSVVGILAAALAAVAAAQAAAPPPPAKDEDVKTVTVTGSGATKEAALRDAQRKALEEGAGTFIFSQSKTENFQLVKDTVLARSAGFIQSVEKISEKETDDGMFEVRIKAVVSVKGIVDTWGTVKTTLVAVGRPKIMVWVNEKIGTEVVPDSTVSAAIEEALLKSGFLLVDHDRIKKLAEKEGALANLEDKPDKLMALLKQEGAQIFITGTANAAAGDTHRGPGEVTLYTYEAECNLRGFLEDTGGLIFKIPGKPTRGVARVARSAAKQALDFQAKQMVEQVVGDILQHWQDWLGGHGELKLEVEGISFKGYIKVRDTLKKIEGVKDVTPQYNNKIANISIQASMKAEALAEAILKALPDLEISDVSANTIKCKYKGTD